jgi:short subunit dehydrogenase-like uncharacterized protein
MTDLMIYGATGFTGTLVADHAAGAAGGSGPPPTLAGRNEAKVRALAERLGLPWTAFDLADRSALPARLRDVKTVLNLAGPFSETAAPLAGACLASGTHYVDITGEIAVFEHLAGLDAEARAAGVVLLPGAGFDVVPSDCLAAHLKRRQPDLRRLRLSLSGLTRASRGTARTAVEALGKGTLVRRGGRIVDLASPPRGQADFGKGPVDTIGVSWGDVATAWHSTGARDIDVLFEASLPLRVAARVPQGLRPALRSRPVQHTLKRLVDRLTRDPSAEGRDAGHAVLLGEGWDGAGARVASLMRTPDPYALTARTALAIARRVAAGGVGAGFHTPSTAFGPDLALDFDGVERTDLA